MTKAAAANGVPSDPITFGSGPGARQNLWGGKRDWLMAPSEQLEGIPGVIRPTSASDDSRAWALSFTTRSHANLHPKGLTCSPAGSDRTGSATGAVSHIKVMEW